MAGHSKWANIRHKKGRVDAARSRVWSKCSRAIIVAAKNGGGDPATNLTLRYAVEEAKGHNMPKDTIAKAIAKGSGDLDGVNYEEVIYEGYGPNGVAIMIEALTDNRNRTAPELRQIFGKNNGSLAAAGSVAFNFERKGEIIIEHADEDTLIETALEAGAEDIQGDNENGWQVLCDASVLLDVKEALEDASFEIAQSHVTMIALNHAAITEQQFEGVDRLIDALEEYDDVQKVHANFDIQS